MLIAEVTVSVHGPVPVQPPPLQPRNVEPAAVVGVSVTIVPWVKVVVQVPGQDSPAGVDAIVPVPLPARAIVTG